VTEGLCCSLDLALDTLNIHSRDCNPGIPVVFANPESRDWQRLNLGISGLQKLAEIVLFCELNDKNKIFLSSGE